MAEKHDTAPKVINGRINGRFAPGHSGNPGGSPGRARQALNADTIREMHRAFRDGGRAAINKVMKNQPAVFLKLLVLLVPREMSIEHSGGVKAMTDEQLEAGIEALTRMLESREAGANAKVVEGVGTSALPRPEPDADADGPSDVMDAADTAVRTRKRQPVKGGVPSPSGD